MKRKLALKLVYYEKKIQQNNNKYATVFYFENKHNYLLLRESKTHCTNNLLWVLETKSKIYLAIWIWSQHYRRKKIMCRKEFPFLKTDLGMKKAINWAKPSFLPLFCNLIICISIISLPFHLPPVAILNLHTCYHV